MSKNVACFFRGVCKVTGATFQVRKTKEESRFTFTVIHPNKHTFIHVADNYDEGLQEALRLAP